MVAEIQHLTAARTDASSVTKPMQPKLEPPSNRCEEPISGEFFSSDPGLLELATAEPSQPLPKRRLSRWAIFSLFGALFIIPMTLVFVLRRGWSEPITVPTRRPSPDMSAAQIGPSQSNSTPPTPPATMDRPAPIPAAEASIAFPTPIPSAADHEPYGPATLEPERRTGQAPTRSRPERTSSRPIVRSEERRKSEMQSKESPSMTDSQHESQVPAEAVPGPSATAETEPEPENTDTNPYIHIHN